MNSSRKLAVGTAQWGLDYGVTNKSGRLEDSVIGALLKSMRANHISHLDTAASYGDSETRIGHLDTTEIDIQTKLSAKGATKAALSLKLQQSLARLKTDSVNSLLIHDWFTLDQNEAESVSQFFEFCTKEGLAQNVGISAYALEDLLSAKEMLSIWNTAQIPINILDQRFIYAGETFPDIAFQARSIFLQGLLLTPSSEHADLIKFHEFCEVAKTNSLDLSLQFIHQQQWLDSVIIAPTSLAEFDQIIRSVNSVGSAINFEQFASSDSNLTDPRTWN